MRASLSLCVAVFTLLACSPPAAEATFDGGLVDGGRASVDAGVESVHYGSLILVSSAPGGASGERWVPLGLPVTFSVHGRFTDGSSEVPSARVAGSVRWKVASDEGAVSLRAHDGLVELIASRAASVQLTAELATLEGFTLSASAILKAVAPIGEVRLRAFTAQDGPWADASTPFTSAAVQNAFNAFDSSAGPPHSAIAPLTGAVRVLTAYLVTLEGRSGVVRYPLDPTRLTYAAGGAATVTHDGVLRAAAPGDVTVTVSMPSTVSTTVSASFVAEAAVSALRLAGEGPVVRAVTSSAVESTAAQGSLTREAVLALPPDQLAGIGFAGTMAGKTTRVWLAAKHGTTRPYLEWLPLSTVSRVVLAPEASVATDDDGWVTMTTPGVGLQVLSAGGRSLPIVIRAPYAFGTALSLRAEPSAVTLAAGACQDLTLYFSAGGAAERALTEVEQLVVVIDPPVNAVGLLEASRTRPLHWCAASSMLATRTASLTLGYLGATTAVSLSVP